MMLYAMQSEDRLLSAITCLQERMEAALVMIGLLRYNDLVNGLVYVYSMGNFIKIFCKSKMATSLLLNA